MDKKALKEVMATLVVGENIELSFRGSKSAKNGTFNVKENKALLNIYSYYLQ